jgi:hypothetical protein
MSDCRCRVEKTVEGYIAPNGLAITPTEEWLKEHGFYLGTKGYFLNWPHMSFVRENSNCIRIEPGVEGIWIVGDNHTETLLAGCWYPERVSELWKVITGQVL